MDERRWDEQRGTDGKAKKGIRGETVSIHGTNAELAHTHMQKERARLHQAATTTLFPFYPPVSSPAPETPTPRTSRGAF